MDKKIKLAYAQSRVHFSYHNSVQEIEKLHLENLIDGFELKKNQVWFNVGLGLLNEETIKTEKPNVKIKLTSSFSNGNFAIVFEIVSESKMIVSEDELSFKEYKEFIDKSSDKIIAPLLYDATSHVLNISKLYSSIPIFLNYKDMVKKN